MRFALDDSDLERLAERLLPLVARRLAPATVPQVERYLSLGDIAKLIGCPSRKALEMRLLRARERGELHPLERMTVMIDGARRWREADVLAWARGGSR